MIWVCITLVLLSFLAYGLAWLWWEWDRSKTGDPYAFYTSPRLTPQELAASHQYTASNPYPKPKPIPAPAPKPELEPEPPPDPAIELKRQQREARRIQWEQERLAKQMAEAQAIADEQNRISREFKPWLLELADLWNVEPNYCNLVTLKEWVNLVMDVAQQELNGAVTVRSLWAALRRSDKATLPNSNSYVGLSKLVRLLEREQILTVESNHEYPNRKRKLSDDFLTRL